MFETTVIIKILLACLTGALIGYERERAKKHAGLRTHILLCLASCVLIIVGLDVYPGEVGRVIAGLITGVGFIGAGTIIADQDRVKGITTAASLWMIVIIGIIIGLGFYEIAIATLIIALIILSMGRFEKKKR